MLYYDRTIHAELLALLQPSAPLGWLLDWIGSHPDSRLEFRRADTSSKHGALQVYLGRTCILSLAWRRGRQLRCAADSKYTASTPELFSSPLAIDSPTAPTQVRQHLDACVRVTDPTFISGEAVSHNGFMRRYGLNHSEDDPLLAVDSEARLGSRADPERGFEKPKAAADALQVAARAAVGLPAKQNQPKKLDAVGVLPNGTVALVEIKDKGGDVIRAAWQAAIHAYNFQTLANQDGTDLADSLNRLIEQKASIGLIPKHASYRSTAPPNFVPIIAAPDDSPTWRDDWERQIADIQTPYLDALELWRLSDTGEIEEQHKCR